MVLAGHLMLAAIRPAPPARETVQAGHASAGPRAAGPSKLLLVTKPIEQIRVGQRVLARNPELTDAERAVLAKSSEPAPDTWRRLKLWMPKPDGGRLDIELLRPLSWLTTAGVPLDGELVERTVAEPVKLNVTIELHLPELGVSGPATLLTVAPCPPIERGPGCVVTGTFRHQSAEILTLTVSAADGRSEQIGVTANHPIWSVDRQQFVPAASLAHGERLLLAGGSYGLVVGKKSSRGTHLVYNLQVAKGHVYHVCSFGIVVHNSCAGGLRYTADQEALIDLAWEMRQRGRTRPLSPEEVQILFEWADEVGLPRRGPEIHPGRPVGQVPHIHIGPIDHIPVQGP